jgi:hypothetical protein
MALLQEKFQVTAERPKKSSHEWVTPQSARRSKSDPAHLNCLPPGDNIGDQQLIDNPVLPRVMSGETDVTQDWNPSAVRKGYRRFDVKPTDDAYTAEHVDTFYGEAVSDGETGFAERGNLLDRI